jgi:hypothetical protein
MLGKHLSGEQQRWPAALLAFSVTSLMAGCKDLPRDQHGWTARIREQGVLTVGVSNGTGASTDLEERERRVVAEVARALGARIVWRRGNAHELLQQLAELKLPLVAASVSTDSPFAAQVGLSQPYWKDGPHHRDYCLAVAPGENQLLLLVDQVIAAQRPSEEKP